MTGPTYTTLAEVGRAFGIDTTGIATQGFQVGNGTAAAATLYSGSGVPSAGLGVNGDFYLRIDTPATLAQRVYIKSAGAWINALA